jgi:hypothetical protein
VSNAEAAFSLRCLFRIVTIAAIVFGVVGVLWRWYDAKQKAYQLRWGPGEVANREHWPSQTLEVIDAIQHSGQDKLEVVAYRQFDGWGHGFFWKLRAANGAKDAIISHWEMQPLAAGDPQVQDFWNYLPDGWLPPPGPIKYEM